MANLVLASKRELKSGMFWYVTPSSSAHVTMPLSLRESMAN